MPPDADGHRYTFGAPSKGWPSFDKNGKRIPEVVHYTDCWKCGKRLLGASEDESFNAFCTHVEAEHGRKDDDE